MMRHGVFALINRPPGPIVAKLRIDGPFPAYVVACIASTSIVAAGHLFLIILFTLVRGEWAGIAPLSFITSGLFVWMILTAVGFGLAAPFVTVATWAGARLNVESVAYYASVGTLIMSVLVLVLFGVPRPVPFGGPYLAWSIGPPCAAAFGAVWWYLHRRWRSEPD